jgi:hypothetical protein
MPNTYARNWESQSPGCMIFLLDQSGSMSDPFGSAQAGRGRKKCDMVATILNNFLNELITINTIPQADSSSLVRPRADICVIGYQGNSTPSVLSGALSGKDFVNLPELQMYPVDVEMRKQKETDDSGREYEIQVPFPLWVRPKADQGTPMCAALRRAWELADQWAITHPDNYPPVIINVTDGIATDGDPTPIAQQITQISTNDGQALLFNVHITNLPDREARYPVSESELPNDRYAKLLFSISSPIPESSRQQLESLLGLPVQSDARGMIFNGDATSIRLMFNFASLRATQALPDPNR